MDCVDLSAFEDQDLIDEINHRGWFVGAYAGWEPDAQLTDEERLYILQQFQHAKPGTLGYFIYGKLNA
jgi:hypothetical protein